MFLEGYRRNWLHPEGFSFEDRMIDDLSVSAICSFIYRCFPFSFTHTFVLLNIPESNGARGGR